MAQAPDLTVAGKPTRYLEWERPPLARLAMDMRRYAEWNIVADESRVVTVLLNATDQAWPTARDEVQALVPMAAGLTPFHQRPRAVTWQQNRDWSDLEDSTQLQWQLPEPGQVMWGMFSPYLHPRHMEWAAFRQFEQEGLGTKLGLLMTYLTLDDPFPSLVMEQAAHDGRLFMLTLQSLDPKQLRQDLYANGRSLAYDILSGHHDEHLRAWARAAASFGKPFLFRLDNEMNGDWSPWSAYQHGKDTRIYREVWRYVHQLFQEAGAINAIWVWNPNCTSFPRYTWQHHALYWPGEDVVDLVGLTCYNTGADNPEGWRTFAEMYQPLYQEYMAWYPDKPFMIGEFVNGGDKAQWIREMFTDLKEMPNIRLAVWWNSQDDIGDYRLPPGSAELAAFREGLQAPEIVNTVRFDGGRQVWSGP